MPKEKMKYLLWYSLALLLILTACDLDLADEGEVNIPEYQEAIYIMDADGSNKTKVIDVDGCENVQFIPNSYKLLYLANNSLYTVNIDGTEKVKISGDINCYYANPVISDDGQYCYFEGYIDRMANADIYKVDIASSIIENLTETPEKHESSIDYSDQYILYISKNDSLSIKNIVIYDLINSETNIILEFLEGVWIDSPKFFGYNKILFSRSGPNNEEKDGIYEYNWITETISIVTSDFFQGNIFVIENMFVHNILGNTIIYSLLDNTIIASLEGKYSDYYSGQLLLTMETKEKRYFQGYNYNTCKYIFESQHISVIAQHTYQAKFNCSASKICCIGQFITNPKSKNQITN